MTRFVGALARIGLTAALGLLGAPSFAHEPLSGTSVAALAATPARDAPASSSASAEPMLGRIQIFEDWAVGCDNRLSCNAVSLVPDGSGTAYSVLVSIQRSGGPSGSGVVRLLGAEELRGKIDLIADNHSLARVQAKHDMVEIIGPAALDMIRSLAASYAFELREGKKPLDAPSLRGLPAALRYIDEQQGRVGSKGALAATGEAPVDMAKPLPTVPIVPSLPVIADRLPLVLTPQEQIAARHVATCEGEVSNDYPLETHMLDADHALVLLPCNAGAYNVSAVPLVATGGQGNWQFQVAHFDHVPGFTGEPGTPPLIVNARWNPARAELSSFAKGRGLGDCGTAETYKWDGTLFRLTEARSMPVCRGAWEWPVLYSAATARG